MNAREMFEELGYSLEVNNKDLIKYSKEVCGYTFFRFRLKDKEFCSGYQSVAHTSTQNELKAVIQQFKELGWIEEEKQEIKQETNIDHYKDGIIELCIDELAISKGKVVECCATPCSECDFEDKNGHCIGNREIMKWLKQPYIKPVYKLTKFEIDLLQSCSQGYSPKYQFKNINSLTEMRKNGYFKNINGDELIKDILENCEVVG